MAKEVAKQEVITDTGYLAFIDFLNEFRAEGDRASVILGAARLDLGLYHLLQHTLLPNTSKADDLLDGDNPLGTFSSRITVCYRLGLIDAQLARGLHLVRKIRNSFAHETSGSSLNSGSHRDRVRELSAPFMRYKGYVDFREKYFDAFEGASRDFRAVLTLIALRLEGGLTYLDPIKANDIITMLPPSFVSPEALAEENKNGSELVEPTRATNQQEESE